MITLCKPQALLVWRSFKSFSEEIPPETVTLTPAAAIRQPEPQQSQEPIRDVMIVPLAETLNAASAQDEN